MVARGRRDNVAFASSPLLLLLLLNVVTTWRSRSPHRRMEALLAYDFNDMKWDFYACPGGAIGEWTVSSLGVKARPLHPSVAGNRAPVHHLRLVQHHHGGGCTALCAARWHVDWLATCCCPVLLSALTTTARLVDKDRQGYLPNKTILTIQCLVAHQATGQKSGPMRGINKCACTDGKVTHMEILSTDFAEMEAFFK